MNAFSIASPTWNTHYNGSCQQGGARRTLFRRIFRSAPELRMSLSCQPLRSSQPPRRVPRRGGFLSSARARPCCGERIHGSQSRGTRAQRDTRKRPQGGAVDFAEFFFPTQCVRVARAKVLIPTLRESSRDAILNFSYCEWVGLRGGWENIGGHMENPNQGFPSPNGAAHDHQGQDQIPAPISLRLLHLHSPKGFS